MRMIKKKFAHVENEKNLNYLLMCDKVIRKNNEKSWKDATD